MIRRSAFTLVEIIVVVVVLGVLAAIAVPKFASARGDVEIAATAADLKALETAMGMYVAFHGSFPPDVRRTQMVEQLDPYFKGDENPFAKPVPIGGVFDYQGPRGRRVPFILIRPLRGDRFTAAQAQALDTYMDDGVASTGRIRRPRANRIQYYLDPRR